jgi:hypothetical protein
MSFEVPSTDLVLKHNPEVFPDYKGFSQETLERDFSKLRGVEYIDAWRRVDAEGQLDIYATAIAVGGIVKHGVSGKGNAYLLRRGEEKVPRFEFQIMLGVSIAQQRYLFGHELAHLTVLTYLSRISPQGRADFYRKQEDHRTYEHLEAFCEYFSMRLLGFGGDLESFSWDSFPDLTSIK